MGVSHSDTTPMEDNKAMEVDALPQSGKGSQRRKQKDLPPRREQRDEPSWWTVEFRDEPSWWTAESRDAPSWWAAESRDEPYWWTAESTADPPSAKGKGQGKAPAPSQQAPWRSPKGPGKGKGQTCFRCGRPGHRAADRRLILQLDETDEPSMSILEEPQPEEMDPDLPAQPALPGKSGNPEVCRPLPLLQVCRLLHLLQVWLDEQDRVHRRADPRSFSEALRQTWATPLAARPARPEARDRGARFPARPGRRPIASASP
mmetsp:Transcript_88065/g.158793  ORF Transcript_88065/g.158793 Transcript_88065/m.158793 type:complete len:260 (+) Transcript_88065:1378-2157(+)